MTTRAQIVAEVRAWIGTPFHHAQAAKGLGTDCIGLIAGVANETGLTSAWFDGRAAPFKGYGKTPDPGKLLDACRQFLDPLPILAVRPGDVLVMKTMNGHEPQHFGIVTAVASGKPTAMVHAMNVVGKVAEQPIDAKWLGRVLYAFRFRGLED
jgi:NlpC/P60 family putative phage cell wall peptidase